MTMVTNGFQSRRARKKATMRTQIVAAAIRLFSKHGIEAVTVDQIAAAADVGKGTIYNYFQTKEDIVVAFMVDCERDVQSRLRDFQSRQRSVAGVLINFSQPRFRMKAPYHAFFRVFWEQLSLQTKKFLPNREKM